MAPGLVARGRSGLRRTRGAFFLRPRRGVRRERACAFGGLAPGPGHDSGRGAGRGAVPGARKSGARKPARCRSLALLALRLCGLSLAGLSLSALLVEAGNAFGPRRRVGALAARCSRSTRSRCGGRWPSPYVPRLPMSSARSTARPRRRCRGRGRPRRRGCRCRGCRRPRARPWARGSRGSRPGCRCCRSRPPRLPRRIPSPPRAGSFMPAKLSSSCTCSSSISFNCPRLMWPGNSTLPKRTRIRRLTVRPTVSIMRRTSRFFPSRRITWYQWLAPSPPRSSIESNLHDSPSMSTPESSSFAFSSSSSPMTRTAYSRSTSKRGWVRRLASSPLVVKMSRPSVLKSRRPTDTQRAPCALGSRSNTVGRFCGSSRVTISPVVLW